MRTRPVITLMSITLALSCASQLRADPIKRGYWIRKWSQVRGTLGRRQHLVTLFSSDVYCGPRRPIVDGRIVCVSARSGHENGDADSPHRRRVAGRHRRHPGDYASDTVRKYQGGYQFSADVRHFELNVSPGDVLAIVLHSAADGAWNFSGEYPVDWYRRGTAFWQDPGAPSWLPVRDDFFFRTYVDPPNPVPEPSTLLLVGTGAIGLIHRLRRRP